MPVPCMKRRASEGSRAEQSAAPDRAGITVFRVDTSTEPARLVSCVVRTLGSWQLLVAGVCGGRRFCGAVRLRSPGEPIAEWGRSAWEVAHESIHACAVYPVAVVGDGRILPFLPNLLVRLVHLDAEVRGPF